MWSTTKKDRRTSGHDAHAHAGWFPPHSARSTSSRRAADHSARDFFRSRTHQAVPPGGVRRAFFLRREAPTGRNKSRNDDSVIPRRLAAARCDIPADCHPATASATVLRYRAAASSAACRAASISNRANLISSSMPKHGSYPPPARTRYTPQTAPNPDLVASGPYQTRQEARWRGFTTGGAAEIPP